jgi:hypothetical protein
MNATLASATWNVFWQVFGAGSAWEYSQQWPPVELVTFWLPGYPVIVGVK